MHSRISELRNDLDESNRLREQLERAATTLVDEVRQMKGRIDTAGVEFNSTLHDVKERTKRIEDEQRGQVCVMQSMAISKAEQNEKFPWNIMFKYFVKNVNYFTNFKICCKKKTKISIYIINFPKKLQRFPSKSNEIIKFHIFSMLGKN